MKAKNNRRMWQIISLEDLEATAFELLLAHDYITNNLPIKTCKHIYLYGSKIDCKPKSNINIKQKNHLYLNKIYFSWMRSCEKHNNNYHACMDAFIFNKTFQEIDRAYKKRNGWAKNNFIDCLRLFQKEQERARI